MCMLCVCVCAPGLVSKCVSVCSVAVPVHLCMCVSCVCPWAPLSLYFSPEDMPLAQCMWYLYVACLCAPAVPMCVARF